MNNKIRLSKAMSIIVLAIIIALVIAYIPMLGIFSMLAAVPYVIIGAITDRKYSLISILVTFCVLILFVDISYALNICIMYSLPGIVIGKMLKRSFEQEDSNKFEPIYGGTIIFVLSMLVYFFVLKTFLNVNLLDEVSKMISEIVNIQKNSFSATELKVFDKMKPDEIVSYFTNMLPMMLFLQGLLSAFVTYYLSVFFIKRITKMNIRFPKFADFYLPGNAILTTFLLYLLVLFIQIIGSKLYTELIMTNLQLVFNLMFVIQGIAVCIYFLKKWIRQGPNKIMFFSGIILCLFGFMGISFVGMVDSIIDFRKVRSYKST